MISVTAPCAEPKFKNNMQKSNTLQELHAAYGDEAVPDTRARTAAMRSAAGVELAGWKARLERSSRQ